MPTLNCKETCRVLCRSVSEIILKLQFTCEIKTTLPSRRSCCSSNCTGIMRSRNRVYNTQILAMDNDPSMLGVMLQRTVPDHINVRSLQSAIDPLKDARRMKPASFGNIVCSDLALAPYTAAASVALMKETGRDLKGLEIVMIGHSGFVGKLAAMMMMMAGGATVTVCHHMTRSVAMHSRLADVVIVVVGKLHLI